VQHNSVELAMEWLFNHQEEDVVAGQQPAADAEAAAAPETDIEGSFPPVIDENLASSSKPPVSIPPPPPVQGASGIHTPMKAPRK